MHRLKKSFFCFMYIKWLLSKVHRCKSSHLEPKRKYIRTEQEISKEPTDYSKIRYVRSDLMEKIIKKCRGVKKYNDGINRMEKEEQIKTFRALLGLQEHDIMLPKEYSAKSKIKKISPNETRQEQYKILGYFIDLAFPVHKLGLEVDENGHMDRSEAEEKERQKATEKETGFTIIGINQGKENFDIFVEIGKMKNYIVESTKKVTKESTKKSIIDDVKKLLKAASKFSNNGTISKFTKKFSRHLLPAI